MASNVVVEMANTNGTVTHMSIPISYKPQTTDTKMKKKLEKMARKKSSQSLSTIQNEKTQRKEHLQNKKILYSAKRGYSVLLIITLLLLIVLALYVLQIDTISKYLYHGITGCMIALLLMIPTFVLYRFAEKKILMQHDTINNKIIHNFSLKQQLELKHEQNVIQKQEIEKLHLILAEQEQKINKLSIHQITDENKANENKFAHKYNFLLIHGFRKGQMEIQIEYAQIHELVAMFNVVVACITLLPFGQTNYRKKLKKILTAKIEKNKYLQMHFYFFLLSYLECMGVKRLFRKHRIMKKVRSLADYYNYADEDFDDAMTVFSDATSVFTERSAPFTPYSPMKANGAMLFPNTVKGNIPLQNVESDEDIIYFKEKDPIKLFRSPIDNKAKPGTIIIVPLELQNRFFDPINGNKFLQQLVVRHIFHSNAKPYLIDCYVKDTIESETEMKNDDRLRYDGMILSSSFILKKGDDLRKDQAVLQMFKFMNDIWKENNLRYQNGKYFVQALIYKLIPMGNDVGIIEMINNCIELNKVETLATTFIGNITERDEYIARDKYNRLITTAAAAYIASFVCGVRDRHHDNVLIETDTFTLFHIDFGYIFKDSPTLDTAKFAITSDLKKLFNSYGNGWNDFIDISCRAWMLLRQNSTELIDFARAAFAFLYTSNDIEQFIRESLKLDLSKESAYKYIWNHLTKAPKQWRTKMKNLAHTFAQKMKKSKSKSNLSKHAHKGTKSKSAMDMNHPWPAPKSKSNLNLSYNHTPEPSIEMSNTMNMSNINLPNNQNAITPNHSRHGSPGNLNINAKDIIPDNTPPSKIYRNDRKKIYNNLQKQLNNSLHRYADSDALHKSSYSSANKSIIVSPPNKPNTHSKTLSLIV